MRSLAAWLVLVAASGRSISLAQKYPSEGRGAATSLIAMLSVSNNCAAGIIVGSDEKSVYIATAAHIAPTLSKKVSPEVMVRFFDYESATPVTGHFLPQFEPRGKGDLAVVVVDRVSTVNKTLDQLDLAILPSDPPKSANLPVHSFGCSGGERGTEGHGTGGRDELLLQADENIVEIQSDAIFGQSGGGIFNEGWELIGMAQDVNGDVHKLTGRPVSSLLSDLHAWHVPVSLKVRPEPDRVKGAEEIAREKGRVATAERIAFSALRSQKSQPELGSLLSIEADQISEVYEARNALMMSLQTRQVAVLHNDIPINCGVFSPDGKVLVTCGTDGMIQLWNSSTSRHFGDAIRVDSDYVRDVAFSPDGKYLAAKGQTKVQTISLPVPQSSDALGVHGTRSGNIAISDDGKKIAMGAGNGTIQMWSVIDGHPLGDPITLGEPRKGHLARTPSVAFSRDSKLLASSCADGSIRLLDVTDQHLIDLPIATQRRFRAAPVVFSPSGMIMAYINTEGAIVLMDVARREPLGPPLQIETSMVEDLAFSSDGKMLAWGKSDGTVWLWDVPDRRLIGDSMGDREGRVRSLSFSPDGKVLASAGERRVRLWSTTKVAAYHLLTHRSSDATAATFSADGKVFASGTVDGQIKLFDTTNWKSIGQPLKGNAGPIWRVQISPNKRYIAAAVTDPFRSEVSWLQITSNGTPHTASEAEKAVLLWDLSKRSEAPRLLKGHSDYVLGLVFSPDGNTLASASADKLIRLWDLRTLQPIGKPLSGHEDYVWDVSFSPDGKLLASASADGTVRLWNVIERHEEGDPLIGHTGKVLSIAFSQDGSELASGGDDGSVLTWDLADRQLSRSVSSQPLVDSDSQRSEYIWRIAFSSDRKTVATAGKTLQMWDLTTLQPLGGPLDQSRPFVDLAFSPEGRFLAAVGNDDVGLLYEIDREVLRERLCEEVDRNLSLSEWQKFIGTNTKYQKTCPQFPAGTGAEPQAKPQQATTEGATD